MTPEAQRADESRLRATGTRVCKQCDEELSLSAFRLDLNGRGYAFRSNTCKGCDKARINQWRRARRRCAGCRKYRMPTQFVLGGRGVRCDVCRKPKTFLTEKESVERKKNARRDYEYAVEEVGMSHLSAIQWIAKGYGIDEDSIRRWFRESEAA